MYIKEEIQWGGGGWVEILSHGKLVGLNLACYQQTKQMSPFSKKERKKKNFASCVLLFRVQTKQTPVHNNEPSRDGKLYVTTPSRVQTNL